MQQRFHPAQFDRTVDQLNELLRAEAAAAEAYEQAACCASDSGDPEVVNNSGLLREMKEDHERAVEMLRRCVRSLGGRPVDRAAAWSGFPAGAHDVCRDPSVLAMLKESEELSIQQYQKTIDTLDSRSADLIRCELIPAHERHIDVLEQLIDSARRA